MKSAIWLSGALFLALGLASDERRTVVKHINPSGLPRPNGYSHVVEVGAGRTIYVSGQVAMDSAGNVVGPGDIAAQTRQVFENLKTALAAADATLGQVVKITVFMTDVSQLAGFRAVRDTYFTQAPPPASSLVEVKRLVRPELLIEIEAVAVAGPATPSPERAPRVHGGA